MAIDATGLMQPIRYEIDINNGLVQTPMRTQLMRGDAKANRVVVALKNGSENVDLSGVTVTGSFVRPPDEAVIPLNGSASGNEAAVELIDACYAEDGYCEIDVMLTVGQTRRTILSLTGYVLKKGSGAVVDVGDVIPSIDDIIAQYAEMQRVTTATQAAGTAATTAASNANAKAQAAQTAATAANTAATEAGAAAGKIDNMTVDATALDTGQPPTAALSEEDGHYLLSLGLPRGTTGATPQISVQATTGAPGSQASVSVTGTAENPVIHLTIPRGDTGEIGALKINGKTPDASGAVTLGAGDVGALAEGATAVDSAKLGGKAPEYYLQPPNLLINSDFLHPVGQAGLGDGVYHGTILYPADMWREWNADATHQFDAVTGLTTSNNCTLAQVAQISLDRIYTIALGFSDGSILCANGVLSTSSAITVAGSNGNASLYVSVETIYYTVRFCTNCIWAALYEGAYTSDTLPPYVPKGYAAELAECRLYYRPQQMYCLYCYSGGYAVGINFEPMRPGVIPTPVNAKAQNMAGDDIAGETNIVVIQIDRISYVANPNFTYGNYYRVFSEFSSDL